MTLVRTRPSIADIVRPTLCIRTEPSLGIAKLKIYGNDADARFRAVAGFIAPPACKQAEKDRRTFAWLAPGEWLVTGTEAETAGWVARTEALAAEDVLAIDVSHSRIAFLIVGSDAELALSAHCPLDLWVGSFPVGSAAQSLFGDTRMFIARLPGLGGCPRFRIIVDHTMAFYVARLLARA